MARRKEPQVEILESMPSDLLETSENIARFKSQVETVFPMHIVTQEQEEVWLLVKARRLLREARAKVLASMPTKPHGVGELEYRTAKGLPYRS